MRDPFQGMLGPGRPEVDCDECFRQLDAFVEREVEHGDATEAMPRLAAHLDGCPVCREEADSMLALLRADR